MIKKSIELGPNPTNQEIANLQTRRGRPFKELLVKPEDMKEATSKDTLVK